ncbi:hypothetical protein L6164_011694 [Bauhinia variegata]|uniref:Uncharacterized protein n=1 Tax=Bauhinia variegata TaxID=167791 RepID=A0ACB9P839_BAUVA|nr:hypothetical protein L6164_011694 [Bauhinia variegata]
MESLLANYASSDEEEQEHEQKPIPANPSKSISEHGEPTSSIVSSLFSSLPQPKSYSLFQSLPQPKQATEITNSLGGDDNDEDGDVKPGPKSKDSGSIAKSSSIFCSLPRPKGSSIGLSPAAAASPTGRDDTDGYGGNSKEASSSSLFSSLPRPKSEIPEQPVTNVSSSGRSTKRVVQFRPPIFSSIKPGQLDDEDDDDDGEKEESSRKKLGSLNETSSVKSFLSSIPAPRNTATLGVPASSGSGRRSIVETEAPTSNADSSSVENNSQVDHNAGDHVNYDYNYNYQYDTDQGNLMNNDTYENYISAIDQSTSIQPEAGISGAATSYYGNNDTYASYSTYGDNAQYGNYWVDGSAATAPEVSGINDIVARASGKRGRNEIPSEIIEVNQEELVKNRPREDQVKLTGIAFGPAYQPVSAKGKPSKLHKRKHQISSLYYDMKQKEMELSERRAKGMLTKAETQAKYGW